MFTTEDQIQNHIDLNLADYTARLILADVLEEAGDKRAEGYRILGRIQVVPDNKLPTIKIVRWSYMPLLVTYHKAYLNFPTRHQIHELWFKKIVSHKRHKQFNVRGSYFNGVYKTRRQCENHAAWTWSTLTEKEKGSIKRYYQL